MKKIFKIIEKTGDISGYISGLLVPLMMILMVVEVITRYFLHQPLMIADEFTAYMLVALSYLGMAFTWRQGGHVRISILTSRLSARLSSKIRIITLILVWIFMLEMVRVAYKMVVYAHKIDLRSPTWLTVPLFWPQMTVLVGFIIFTLVLTAEIIRGLARIRAGEILEGKIK